MNQTVPSTLQTQRFRLKKLLLFLSLMMTSLMMASHVHARARKTAADQTTIEYMQRKIEQGGWDAPQIGRDGLPQICVPITCHIVRFSMEVVVS